MVKSGIGILFALAGLALIFLQAAVSIGWIKKPTSPPVLTEGLPVPESVVKFFDKLLDSAGWMVITGLILIYVSCGALDIPLFGSRQSN